MRSGTGRKLESVGRLRGFAEIYCLTLFGMCSMLLNKAVPQICFMMNSLKKLWWLLVIPLSAQLLVAQPSGYVIVDFDSISAPLWDLSGPYEFSAPATGAGGQEIPVVYTVYLEHQVNGALRGSGTTTVRIGNEVVAANYTISGKVNGANGITKADFTIALKGRGTLAGRDRNFTVSTSFRMLVSDWGTLNGSASGSVKVSGAGASSIKVLDYDVDLPNGVAGDWRLVLNYIPFKRFAGTGAVYVSTAFPLGAPTLDSEEFRIFPGKISGTYSQSKDLTVGQFDGTGSGKGAAVRFEIEGFNSWIKGTANILGQRLQL